MTVRKATATDVKAIFRLFDDFYRSQHAEGDYQLSQDDVRQWIGDPDGSLFIDPAIPAICRLWPAGERLEGLTFPHDLDPGLRLPVISAALKDMLQRTHNPQIETFGRSVLEDDMRAWQAVFAQGAEQATVKQVDGAWEVSLPLTKFIAALNRLGVP